MINVTVGEQKTQESKPFPKLMKSEKTGSIIFATGENSIGYNGTLLLKGNTIDTLGEYSSEWSKKLYDDFNEPITLQNA